LLILDCLGEYLEDREGDWEIENGRIEKSAAQYTKIDHRRVLISAIVRM
jgi:hypothetical protein